MKYIKIFNDVTSADLETKVNAWIAQNQGLALEQFLATQSSDSFTTTYTITIVYSNPKAVSIR